MAETLRELVVALSLDSSNFSRNQIWQDALQGHLPLCRERKSDHERQGFEADPLKFSLRTDIVKRNFKFPEKTA